MQDAAQTQSRSLHHVYFKCVSFLTQAPPRHVGTLFLAVNLQRISNALKTNFGRAQDAAREALDQRSQDLSSAARDLQRNAPPPPGPSPACNQRINLLRISSSQL
mmetsp:Transcript_51834/g.135214  ORF Transcript_51834/g.135214 Transcript_51834/m.135214 type:complete len:105 (-) Transcript_51834:2348-2662(-)